jgi:purine-binding chemotaxis protein CheW
MDIAKIRKKLKEKDIKSQQSIADDKTAEEHEATSLKPEEKKSELITPETDIDQEAKAAGNEKIKVEKEKTKGRVIEDKIEEDKTGDVIEILTFSLLKEEYAFRISQLEEIRRYQRITPVPKMPNYVLGITSLRGKVIPVIDLKTKLSLKDKPSGIDQRGKILIIKGPKGPIGVAVDKVIGVIRIAKNEILPPPSHLTEKEIKFIEGIAVVDKRFISIIHMEETININE